MYLTVNLNIKDDQKTQIFVNRKSQDLSLDIVICRQTKNK